MTQCKFTFLSTWPRLLAVQERHKAAPFVRLRPPPSQKMRTMQLHHFPLTSRYYSEGILLCWGYKEGAGEDGHFISSSLSV